MLTRSADSFAEQRAEVAELAVLGAGVGRENERYEVVRGGVRMGCGPYLGRRLARRRLRSEAGSGLESRLHQG